MKRETLQALFNFIMKTISRPRFEGLEHVPTEGSVLVTTNHLSRFDIPMLFMTPNRPDIVALVTDKYKSNPFFSFIVHTTNCIWLDRSKADFTAFREAIGVLKNGGAVGIAPEGTRSQIGELMEGKAGTTLLALRSGAPIVPVGIRGSDTATRDTFLFKRPYITARFGPVYHLPPMDRENRDEYLQWAIEEIMCRIAVLLPEKYYGFYRGHPRLQELIAEQQPEF
jgi:1-acyl-sn-glycerol-3-phosphate acyltransferase